MKIFRSCQLSDVVMSFKVHSDVLKMAKTEEKRERIKWDHAMRVFIDVSVSEGFELARQCRHDDALFLVSLFRQKSPNKQASGKERVFAPPRSAMLVLGRRVWG